MRCFGVQLTSDIMALLPLLPLPWHMCLSFCPWVAPAAVTTPEALPPAGINDWGGISPVTRDHVNPEKPWPQVDRLAAVTADAGFALQPRLPVYPAVVQAAPDTWLSTYRVAPPAPLPMSNSGASAANDAPRRAGPAQSAHALGRLAHGGDGAVDAHGALAQSVYGKVQALADSAGLARADTWRAGQASGDATAPRLDVRGQRHAADAALPSAAPAAHPGAAATRRSAPGGMQRPRWGVQMDAWGALSGVRAPDESAHVTEVLERVRGLHSQCLDMPAEERVSCAAAREAADEVLTRPAVAALLATRGADARAVCAAADELRAAVHGDRVSYVVNRNINYTNVCTFGCGFCAFSKGRVAEDLRGPAYLLQLDEVGRRVAEAWDRGATEVCLQGAWRC